MPHTVCNNNGHRQEKFRREVMDDFRVTDFARGKPEVPTGKDPRPTTNLDNLDELLNPSMAQKAPKSLEEIRRWTIVVESVELKEKCVNFSSDVRSGKESRKALLITLYHDDEDEKAENTSGEDSRSATNLDNPDRLSFPMLAQQALESHDEEVRKRAVATESVELKVEGLSKINNDVRAGTRAKEVFLASRYHGDGAGSVMQGKIEKREHQSQHGFKIKPPFDELTSAESEWSAGRLAQLMWSYYNHDFGPMCKINCEEDGSSMPVIQAN